MVEQFDREKWLTAMAEGEERFFERLDAIPEPSRLDTNTWIAWWRRKISVARSQTKEVHPGH